MSFFSSSSASSVAPRAAGQIAAEHYSEKASEFTSEAAAAELAALGLSRAELAALTDQGCVIAERRGASTSVFKLRFRLGGRQKTKYLGSDAAAAARIGQALAAWQAPRQRDRRLRCCAAKGRALLRDVKRRLEGSLQAAGFKFHGRAIRRPRCSGPVIGQEQAPIAQQGDRSERRRAER